MFDISCPPTSLQNVVQVIPVLQSGRQCRIFAKGVDATADAIPATSDALGTARKRECGRRCWTPATSITACFYRSCYTVATIRAVRWHNDPAARSGTFCATHTPIFQRRLRRCGNTGYRADTRAPADHRGRDLIPVTLDVGAPIISASDHPPSRNASGTAVNDRGRTASDSSRKNFHNYFGRSDQKQRATAWRYEEDEGRFYSAAPCLLLWATRK